MKLLRAMLLPLVIGILAAGFALMAVGYLIMMITRRPTLSLVFGCIAAVIAFLFTYSYFLATSDYKVRPKYEWLFEEVSRLEAQKALLDKQIIADIKKSNAARNEAEHALSHVKEKLKVEKQTLKQDRILFDWERKKHYEKLGLQSEGLLKNRRIVDLINDLLVLPADQQEYILNELNKQIRHLPKISDQ